MTILRHTFRDTDVNLAIELVHGVEVQLIDLDLGKVVLRKVFTGLDDKRDARKYFNLHVAALGGDGSGNADSDHDSTRFGGAW